MKKLVMILSITLLVLQGCKKNNNNTQQTQQQQQQAPPPPPPPALSAQESQLIGLWIMDSTVWYNNNIRGIATVHTNSLSCRLEFKSTFFPNQTEYRIAESGIGNCVLAETMWKAPNLGAWQLGASIFPITLITATKLNFIQGGGGGLEYRYYLHK